MYTNFPESSSLNSHKDLSIYPPFPLTNVPIYSVHYVPASQLESNFYSFIQDFNPIQIENDTNEQSSCPQWFKYRQFRFTASKFHSVLIRKRLDCEFAKSFLPVEEKPASDFLRKNLNMEMSLSQLLPASIHNT